MTDQKKLLTANLNAVGSLEIETVTGRLVDPSNPSSASIAIEDIAWALSRIPRFAGHTITEIPYNVAQHSVYVADLVMALIAYDTPFKDTICNFHELQDAVGMAELNVGQDRLILAALLHDAHEAYIGDIPSPIKKIPELRDTFKRIEADLDLAIFEQFGLEEMCEHQKMVIKWADKLAQAIEGYQFMPSRGLKWDLPTPTLELLQNFQAPMSPIQSYGLFIKRFNDIKSNL